jgi:hypothetical protein
VTNEVEFVSMDSTSSDRFHILSDEQGVTRCGIRLQVGRYSSWIEDVVRFKVMVGLCEECGPPMLVTWQTFDPSVLSQFL